MIEDDEEDDGEDDEVGVGILIVLRTFTRRLVKTKSDDIEPPSRQ